MSTPANDIDNPYWRQLRLLVQVLPFVGRETCFGLKGGTAINLFYRDMPRYSVDIDLAYLPDGNFETSQREIDAGLRRIGAQLSAGSPAFGVTFGRGAAGGLIDTITVHGVDTQIKVEVNPVLRGTVFPVRQLEVREVVSAEFGFADAQVLSPEDTFAGKLVAALDRQHPRDLFDVKLLFDHEGISDDLLRTFVVYLIGHKGSLTDVLDPRRKELSGLYHGQFLRMTNEEIPLSVLEEVRERLIAEVRGRLDPGLRRLLLSVQRGKPDWSLLGLPGVGHLPAVRWRMLNIDKMSREARDREVARLEQLLESR